MVGAMTTTSWDAELGDIDGIVERALAEDLAAGDVTARATVRAGTHARAMLVAKAPLVVCGLAVAARVFGRLDPASVFTVEVPEGTPVPARTVLARVEGDARALLGAERTALNLVQRMCGIATTTAKFVAAAAGRCRVTDTRKTMPGLRALDRYAVRTGGGHNHRNDLGAGVLIKENHIRAAGGIAAAVAAAKTQAPHTMRIECEVTTIGEVDEALTAGAEAILLDNMDDAAVRAALERIAGRAVVEVSGNVDLARVGRLAALGVDLVSVGALTHSVVAGDVSLLFETRS
jgi:nicotinate-nucleotide pyrophosphorylase (carboxylating)